MSAPYAVRPTRRAHACLLLPSRNTDRCVRRVPSSALMPVPRVNDSRTAGRTPRFERGSQDPDQAAPARVQRHRARLGQAMPTPVRSPPPVGLILVSGLVAQAARVLPPDAAGNDVPGFSMPGIDAAGSNSRWQQAWNTQHIAPTQAT